MNDSINLGLGFDSQNVGEATRELKQQIKTVGAMYAAFMKLAKAGEDTAEAEEKVVQQMKSIGIVADSVLKGVQTKFRNLLNKIIPGSGKLVDAFIKVKNVLGSIIGMALTPIMAPFKWLLKNGLKIWNWATDFNSRIQEIVRSATELENRFVRFTNLFGSKRFAKDVNSWQYDMLQNLPIMRDELQDFTVQLRELGLDPTQANMKGVVGAALGPGNSFSQVMSSLVSTAKDGDVQGLMEALGNTVDPREIMQVLAGATSQQEKFLKLLGLMNKKYGDNVENTSRIIGVNMKYINEYWNEFKESLVGTPQEGNLMWYIQQVFIDIKGWIGKNKATLMSFAKSISTVLGGVGKVIYNLFKGITGFGAKAIGGVQNAAEKFKKWAMHSRIVLEWWANQISHVFDEAATSGQGFWKTMRQLWDEVFGGNKGGMVDTFWNKFKEYGKNVIDWLGEKFATVFGHHFKKGVVTSLKKDDGTFGLLVPDFVKTWDNQVRAVEDVKKGKFSSMTSSQATEGLAESNALKELFKRTSGILGIAAKRNTFTDDEWKLLEKAGYKTNGVTDYQKRVSMGVDTPEYKANMSYMETVFKEILKANNTSSLIKPQSFGHIKDQQTSGKRAFDYFKSQGMSPQVAAGLVGNLVVESGNFDPDVISGKKTGDGGKAVGVAQWHPDRQANFKAQFGKDLKGSSLEEQLAFIAWELKNTESRAWTKIKGAETAENAAALVDKYYERSSGEHRSRREKAAGSAEDVYHITNNIHVAGNINDSATMVDVQKKVHKGTRGGIDSVKGGNNRRQVSANSKPNRIISEI